MTDKPTPPHNMDKPQDDICGQLLARAPQDLVFKMSFIGESQHLLFNHFREMITKELLRQGVDAKDDPLVGLFAEAHASELREFVLTGVSLQRLFRIKEVEDLIGDAASMMLVDIWDSLQRYIQSAEEQFVAQAKDLPEMFEKMERQAQSNNEAPK